MQIHPKMKHVYVGIDTHKKDHKAVIIDCFSEKLGEVAIKNRPSDFPKLIEEVNKYVSEGLTPVFGLEDTGSAGRALALYLLENKYITKNVYSALSFSERRNQAIKKKDDYYDALCVARVLLTKLNELPEANPIDIYVTLKTLVSRRKAIVKSNTALKNQLHGYISTSYPSYKQFFSVFDSKTALGFWENYPSPSKLEGVSDKELGDYLKELSSGYFSRDKAKEILKLVKKDGDTTGKLQETNDFLITITVRQYKQNIKEIGDIENEIKKLVNRLDYKLESMIGIDLVTAASFIAEIGDINRFADANKLARYSGIAPITEQSGDTAHIYRNKQGNRTLYGLFHDLAARQICCGRNKDKPVNDIFYDYYKKVMSRGKTEHQALILVMRRLVNIIYGLMKSKKEYVHPTLPKANAS